VYVSVLREPWQGRLRLTATAILSFGDGAKILPVLQYLITGSNHLFICAFLILFFNRLTYGCSNNTCHPRFLNGFNRNIYECPTLQNGKNKGKALVQVVDKDPVLA
jgi:hypothetical protein